MKPSIPGAMIRLPDLSLVHDPDTIVDDFCSALPAGYFFTTRERRVGKIKTVPRDNRVLTSAYQLAPATDAHKLGLGSFLFRLYPNDRGHGTGRWSGLTSS